MYPKSKSSFVKYFLIIAGIAVTISGLVKDTDIITFIGVALVIGAFFLNNI
ncbi:hypothetical protein [Ginsengibacter hankyongi]|uniref:hypothetical protein n=1 Tax=Ginsengibacter hankyongi TaxID=2607284 RepID=UPI001F3703D8|nr:hypothetical protein [Ginsengibacter hankyongi]